MEINGTLLVELVFFLFLLLWLSKFLFSPMEKLLEEREKRIDGAKKEAIQLQNRAHKSLMEIKETIKKAKLEAQKILSDLREEGLLYQRRIMEEAQDKAREELKVARMALIREVDLVRTNIPQESEELSSLICHKVLKSVAENDVGARKTD